VSRSAVMRCVPFAFFWFFRALRPIFAADSRYRGILTLVGTGVLLLLCARTVNAQAPIRIGASMGLTGAYAQFGQTIQRGYQLCLKHANEKGGVLGRKLELTVLDDQSQIPPAVAIYERLLTEDKVDLIFSPYSSPTTDAVAAVTEKYGKPMVAAGAATTSLFKKGRRFLFMLLSPAEVYLEGLIDLAAKRGLKTIAVIHEDTLFPKAIAQGAVDLARKRGMQVVSVEHYPRKTTDFTPILTKFKAANPDVIAAATYFDDAVAIARGLRELDINPKKFAVTAGGDLPKFHEALGRTAEYVYGGSQWEENLVTLRAGGLVPVARQYPGASEFVEAYRKEFPGADLSYQTAQGYAACQVLLEGVRRAGVLDGEKIRAAILKFDSPTVFGAFKVDQDGFQIGHKMVLFQWQDGKKAIVWPEELAADRPRFPTPPWNQRK
jgi:branched-chain amino acid transport system substrate-binding protein